MIGVLRRHLLSIVCFCLAGAIGLAAIADHRDKNARSNRAQVSEWYCAHTGTRCGGPSSARIEEHWQQRQIGYEAAVIALGGFAIVRFAYRSVRR
jgi:hypothetical protein